MGQGGCGNALFDGAAHQVKTYVDGILGLFIGDEYLLDDGFGAFGHFTEHLIVGRHVANGN